MRREVPQKELVREGNLVAEVDVVWFDDDHPWSPTISASDARKLEHVRYALRCGDLATVRTLARLFELVPLADRDVVRLDCRRSEPGRVSGQLPQILA